MEPRREAEEQSKEKQQGRGQAAEMVLAMTHSYITPPHLPMLGDHLTASQKPRCLLGTGVSYLLRLLQRIRLVASQPSRGFLCLLCRQKVKFSLHFPLQGAESCAETQAVLLTSPPLRQGDRGDLRGGECLQRVQSPG